MKAESNRRVARRCCRDNERSLWADQFAGAVPDLACRGDAAGDRRADASGIRQGDRPHRLCLGLADGQQMNRRAAITQAPEPGRLNGVLPVAPRGQIGMLSDYIDPGPDLRHLPESGRRLRPRLLLARRGAGGHPGAGFRRPLLGLRALRRAHRPVRADRQALRHQARLLPARRSELERRRCPPASRRSSAVRPRSPTSSRASSWTTRTRTGRPSSR